MKQRRISSNEQRISEVRPIGRIWAKRSEANMQGEKQHPDDDLCDQRQASHPVPETKSSHSRFTTSATMNPPYHIANIITHLFSIAIPLYILSLNVSRIKDEGNYPLLCDLGINNSFKNFLVRFLSLWSQQVVPTNMKEVPRIIQ